MTRPIYPEEVVDAKREAMPDEVTEVFNRLIAKKWDGHQSVILLDNAMEAVIEALGLQQEEGGPSPRRIVFNNNWLDIEEIFRSAGWDVEYDKPGYNETYKAKFIFTKKGKKG